VYLQTSSYESQAIYCQMIIATKNFWRKTADAVKVLVFCKATLSNRNELETILLPPANPTRLQFFEMKIYSEVRAA
jgi:hypothetical protein